MFGAKLAPVRVLSSPSSSAGTATKIPEDGDIEKRPPCWNCPACAALIRESSGVVQEQALTDTSLIKNPNKKMLAIMKDGKLNKNTLSRPK